MSGSQILLTFNVPIRMLSSTMVPILEFQESRQYSINAQITHRKRKKRWESRFYLIGSHLVLLLTFFRKTEQLQISIHFISSANFLTLSIFQPVGLMICIIACITLTFIILTGPCLSIVKTSSQPLTLWELFMFPIYSLKELHTLLDSQHSQNKCLNVSILIVCKIMINIVKL